MDGKKVDIIKNNEIKTIISKFKQIVKIPDFIIENLEKVISYQNNIINDLYHIIHKYEGKDADLQTLEESLSEFKIQNEIAKFIQSKIFPSFLPDNDFISIIAKLNPIGETSGDFYDVIEIIPNSVYGVFLADVTGHGVSAALVTIIVKILLSEAIEKHISTKHIMEYINREMCKIFHQRIFFTAFCIVIDFHNKQISYTTGGHSYNLRYNAKTKNIKKITTLGSMMGVMEKLTFPEKIIKLCVNDKFIIYTDGIVETQNDKGQQFGEKRLQNLILEHIDTPSDILINIIEKELKTFMGRNKYDDDITIIIIDIKSDKSDKIKSREYYSKQEVNRFINYYKKSIKINEKNNNKIGKIQDLKNLGKFLSTKGQNIEALKYLKEAEKLILEINSKKIIEIDIDIDIGKVFYYLGEAEKALKYAEKALKYFININDKEGISNAYNLMFMIYSRKSNNNKAKKCLYNALEIEKKTESNPSIMKNLAMTYNNLGYCYGNESNFEKSLEYYLKSLEIAEKYDLMNTLLTLMNNIGNKYRQKAEFKKALRYFYNGLLILEDVDNKSALIVILSNIALIYSKQEEIELAFYYFRKAISATVKYKLYYLESMVRSTRAYKYIKIGNVKEFLDDTVNSLTLNQKIKVDPSQGLLDVAIGIFFYEQNPEDINHETLKLIKSYSKNRTDAEYFFKNAIEKSAQPMNSDSHIPALYEYAKYQYIKGKKKNAINIFKKALKVSITHKNYCEKETIIKILSQLDLNEEVLLD